MEMTVNMGICIVIIIVMIIMAASFRKNKYKNEQLPEFVSIVGVIGTFIGITFGLMKFDTNAIEQSIPILLGGMKTAFITSIAGMVISMAMKAVAKRKSSADEEELDYEDGIEVTKELVKEIKNLNRGITQNQEGMKTFFENMNEERKEENRVLVEELKSIKVEQSSKSDELITEFKVFAENMTEMNSKSIIEALNEVISDFNNNLTEQFGENFKELNIAVGKLLQWQEDYKENIEISTNQLRNSMNSIGVIEDSMKNIAEQADVMIESHKLLEGTLKELSATQDGIQKNNEIIMNSSDKVKELLPMLDSYAANFSRSMEDISTMAARESNNLKEEFSSLMNSMNNVVPDMNDQLKESSAVFNENLITFKNEVQSAIDANHESIKEQVISLEKFNQVIHKGIEDANRSMVDQINQIVENTEKLFVEKVDRLDETLQTELNNSLKILGTHLVQISNKFAEDYTPLAERLKEVVNIARKVS